MATNKESNRIRGGAKQERPQKVSLTKSRLIESSSEEKDLLVESAHDASRVEPPSRASSKLLLPAERLTSEASLSAAFTANSRQVTESAKSRLGVIPFSVLLPQLGHLSWLVQFKDALARRHHELASLQGIDAEEISKHEVAEEQMLKQVMQWLSLEDTVAE